MSIIKIDVCVCTHNPVPEIFAIVLQALANQTIDRTAYRVWIIDNASTPAISSDTLMPLSIAGIEHHLILEPNLGIMYARRRAIESTQENLLVFVDDDNQLDLNYLKHALEIATKHPEIGCFGGKLLLDRQTKYPQWVEPILPYLAIKDVGDLEITECSQIWGLWEPPTAGMVVRRELLNLYLDRLNELPKDLLLGRKGTKGLLSGEDSLIARGAHELNFSCSYQPKLHLIHHLKPQRFRFLYLLKLLYSYGRSYVLLERILGNPVPKIDDREIFDFMQLKIESRRQESRSFYQFLCMTAWDCGYLYESRQERSI
jgi:glycosyltransferase involved in cell wall biosynthesis